MGQRFNGGGPVPPIDLGGQFANASAIKTCINLQLPSPQADLFSTCAEGFAQLTHLEGEHGRNNKTTQIRRFFEELVIWDERCADKKSEEFSEVLPYIRLIRSKVAYSKGRKLITAGFADVLSHLVEKINSPKTLKNARLFMEATIGFRRALEN